MEAWMCEFDWLKVMAFVKDLLVAIAAIVTGTVAIRGFSKWRSEEQGKADFELARRALKLIFRFRTEFQKARTPLVQAGEFPTDYDPMKRDPQVEAAAWAHVFNERLLPVRTVALQLDEVRDEVEGLWGHDMAAAVQQVIDCHRSLVVAMSAYVSNAAVEGKNFAANTAFGRAINSTVFDTGAKINDDGTEGGPNDTTVMILDRVDRASVLLRTKLPNYAG